MAAVVDSHAHVVPEKDEVLLVLEDTVEDGRKDSVEGEEHAKSGLAGNVLPQVANIVSQWGPCAVCWDGQYQTDRFRLAVEPEMLRVRQEWLALVQGMR